MGPTSAASVEKPDKLLPIDIDTEARKRMKLANFVIGKCTGMSLDKQGQHKFVPLMEIGGVSGHSGRSCCNLPITEQADIRTDEAILSLTNLCEWIKKEWPEGEWR